MGSAGVGTSQATFTLSYAMPQFFLLVFTANIGSIFRNSVVFPGSLFSSTGAPRVEIDFQTGGTPYWMEFQRVDDTHLKIQTNLSSATYTYTGGIQAYVGGLKLVK